jgi:UDP-2-acetamido-2,6-beta-L-arabino-hexul-4-ose reductase
MKNVVITGSKGFVGRNLIEKLSQYNCFSVSEFDADNNLSELEEKVICADIIVHLAGVNRPQNIEEFANVNAGLTEKIINIIKENNLHPKIILSSSTQAALDNPYGMSKREAENLLISFKKESDIKLSIFRFPGIFGKYCRPNYNSVVATFCYNISHNLPIQISNPENEITLVYIDDVLDGIINSMKNDSDEVFEKITPEFITALGELSKYLYSFNENGYTKSANDFLNKLYATYLYYISSQY